MRSISYGRQSKDSGRSIAEQLVALQADTDAQGDQTVATLQDGVSASRFSKQTRGDWAVLLELIRQDQADVIRLWESSRGDRSLTTWSGFLDLCRAHGVKIRVTSHNRTYDLSVPRDWRTLAEDGVDSAYESEKTSLRNRRAALENAQSGNPGGKLEFGYTRTYNERRELIAQVINETEAAIIREAAKRVAKGEALRRIELDFATRGITTRKGAPFDSTRIRRVCTNPTYLGMRVFKGEILGRAIWPAILDQATFDICVERLSDKERKTWKDGSTKHLLSKIALCAECGSLMNITNNRGIQYYRCMTNFCTQVKVSDADTYVADYCRPFMIRIREERRATHSGATDTKRAEEIERLEARLVEIEEAIANGELSVRVGGKSAKRVQDALDAFSRAATTNVNAKIVRFVSSAWDDCTIEQQRNFVRAAVVVKVKKVGRVGCKGAPIEQRMTVEDAELEEVML